MQGAGHAAAAGESNIYFLGGQLGVKFAIFNFLALGLKGCHHFLLDGVDLSAAGRTLFFR